MTFMTREGLNSYTLYLTCLKLYPLWVMRITLDNAEQIFAAAYEKYADAIFRHCYFRVFDQDRGKELMQECFMKTWEYLTRGKEIDNVQAFLYRTANNLIIDEVRRSKKRKVESLETLQEEGFDVGTDEDSEAMKSKIGEERIIAILQQVEHPYREVLIMRFIDGLQPVEIAELLRESANAVSVRINRGVKKLRSLLGDDWE